MSGVRGSVKTESELDESPAITRDEVFAEISRMNKRNLKYLIKCLEIFKFLF